MTIVNLKYILFIFLLLLTLSTTAQRQGLIDLETPTTPIEKWGFLQKILKNKRIVALGESLHGVKEYNTTKIELIQYLHEELGYNVIALESDVARNYLGNTQRSHIPDSVLLKELFPDPWHTEEYLEFVRYVKAHPKLQLIGFDVYEKHALPTLATSLGIALDQTDPAIQMFQDVYDHWTEVNGRILVTSNKRDSTMATIVQWIIDDLYPQEKIIILAHNAHISKAALDNACMGALLHKNYRQHYYSIGFFHSLGNPKHIFRKQFHENEPSKLPEHCLQAKFLTTGYNQVFAAITPLQKRRFPWFFKTLDNVTSTQYYNTTIHLAQSFDGLIWIKEVTHPTYVIYNPHLDR